jgi:hypothetical protein
MKARNGIERLAMMLSYTDQGVLEGEWTMWEAEFVGHVVSMIDRGQAMGLIQERVVLRLAGKHLCRLCGARPIKKPGRGRRVI